MTSVTDEERVARAGLSRVAEPGDTAVGARVAALGAVRAWDEIRSGTLAVPNLSDLRARVAAADPLRDLETLERLGGRFVCPAEAEWPTQLDDLGAARPFGLWLRGARDVRLAAVRSVAVVGARAATAYGEHVSGELASDLADAGWAVVSGGAYGIDAASHRGALAAGGVTVVVLASGLDAPYPRGHDALFQRIAAEGALVSEWPPGSAPTRLRFLVRNRVIAALARGTVVVEAAARSGALNTARHARDLNRLLMAVPGPVTSALSVGCHRLLREGATCVTRASEVIEEVGAIGELALPLQGAARPRDHLDPTTRRVLEAVPARRGAGPASIAVVAGVNATTAGRCLGTLWAQGLVERVTSGWRLTATGRVGPEPGQTSAPIP